MVSDDSRCGGATGIERFDHLYAAMPREVSHSPAVAALAELDAF